jgi:hypothetical protein
MHTTRTKMILVNRDLNSKGGQLQPERNRDLRGRGVGGERGEKSRGDGTQDAEHSQGLRRRMVPTRTATRMEKELEMTRSEIARRSPTNLASTRLFRARFC